MAFTNNHALKALYLDSLPVFIPTDESASRSTEYLHWHDWAAASTNHHHRVAPRRSEVLHSRQLDGGSEGSDDGKSRSIFIFIFLNKKYLILSFANIAHQSRHPSRLYSLNLLASDTSFSLLVVYPQLWHITTMYRALTMALRAAQGTSSQTLARLCRRTYTPLRLQSHMEASRGVGWVDWMD